MLCEINPQKLNILTATSTDCSEITGPRSNSPARKRPVPGNSGDFVEAVFRPENFRFFPMISGVFLEDPATFPHLSCRIPRDPVAGIIDLGIYVYTNSYSAAKGAARKSQTIIVDGKETTSFKEAGMITSIDGRLHMSYFLFK